MEYDRFLIAGPGIRGRKYLNSQNVRQKIKTERIMENTSEDRASLKQVKAPYVGAVVVYRPSDGSQDAPARNNFAEEIPAIVTRTWGDEPNSAINLKCFPDGPGTLWRTSVQHQTLGISQEQVIQDAIPVIGADGSSWRWPDEALMVSSGGSHYDENDTEDSQDAVDSAKGDLNDEMEDQVHPDYAGKDRPGPGTL